MSEQVFAYTDGGSRGNPGPAAAAFILKDQGGKVLAGSAFFLGKTTNNVAEYTAVLKALEAALTIGAKKIALFSDSELLVNQINGSYKVKSENIAPLFRQAMDMLDSLESWDVKYVNRQKNQQADDLVNRCLDIGRDFSIQNQAAKQAKPVRLGVLISGGGSTLMNILDQIKNGSLNAVIPLVISSRSDVAGVEKAKAAGLNIEIIRTKDYPDIDRFSSRIVDSLAAANVELVIQAGWLCLWKIPDKFLNRVMNIHPALLPHFGGKGMYGHSVHEAVLAAGCKVSGCTVHFCTNEYDKGPIIIQRCCPVKDDDTPDTLAERVFEQECIVYPQAISLFAENKIIVDNGKVKIQVVSRQVVSIVEPVEPRED